RQATPSGAQASTQVNLPPGFTFDAATKTLTITATAAQNTFASGQVTTQDSGGTLHTTYTFTLNGNSATYVDASLTAVVVKGAAGGFNTGSFYTYDSYTGKDGQTHETAEAVTVGNTGGKVQ